MVTERRRGRIIGKVITHARADPVWDELARRVRRIHSSPRISVPDRPPIGMLVLVCSEIEEVLRRLF